MRRGLALHRAGRIGEALPIYERVLTMQPQNGAALHYAALLGRHLNDHARANGLPTKDNEVMSLMALSILANPENAAGIHNFAKFKHDRGEVDDARQLYEHAVAIDPEQGESWTNLGNIYGELGNRMRAEACWVRAIECPLGSSDSVFNMSFLHLLKGDWAGGWQRFESRWECPTFLHNYGRSDIGSPRWNGSSTTETVYVHGEQGAGDVLMMARYIPLVCDRVGAVILEVLPALVSLFECVFPDLEIVARGDAVPEHGFNVPMFSLPAIFGTTLESLPENPRIADELASIPVESGRIGLCWRGSTTHTNDRVRSMSFEACFPMLDVPGLTWQSLQFGYETGPPLDPLPPGDFLETARQIMRCELVVSVDTSVAHLAGMLGKPTWILLPFSAEWRWLQDRTDTPWYPTAWLWRQDVAGNWKSLTATVARALAQRSDPHQIIPSIP